MAAEKRRRNKAETPTVQARVDEVIRIRLEGGERRDIVNYVREQEVRPGSLWHADGTAPLSISAIENYIAKADESLREKHDKSRKDARRRHLAQRRHLYKKAVKKDDLKTAKDILKDEAEMLGLYPPKKTADTDSKGRDRAERPRQEREDDIRRLFARFGIHPRPGVAPPPPCGDGGGPTP